MKLQDKRGLTGREIARQQRRRRNEIYLKKMCHEIEICRTAVDIQGLFATGAGRAPSAAGQPEQVLDIVMKNFF